MAKIDALTLSYKTRIIIRKNKCFIIGFRYNTKLIFLFGEFTETRVTHIKQKKLCKWYHKLVGYFIDHTASDGEKFIHSFFMYFVSKKK